MKAKLNLDWISLWYSFKEKLLKILYYSAGGEITFKNDKLKQKNEGKKLYKLL